MLDIHKERILVTGGLGFLGKYVVEELKLFGVDTSNIFVFGKSKFDLTKEEDVIDIYKLVQPTVVIHLAAEVGGIGANQKNPGKYFHSNMIMGLHLVEHARINNIKKFVQIGTACAYPKITPIPFKEEDFWKGYPEETNAPYAIAKKSMLTMIQAYNQQYNFNGIYLIPVNLYGPGDSFDLDSGHAIPSLIRKFCAAIKNGSPKIDIWGTGTASREFLHAADAARAIVLATFKYKGNKPINIGSGDEITIRELVDKLQKITGFDGEIEWNTHMPDGQPRRCLDVSKLEKLLDFKTNIPFDVGLKQTVDWWKEREEII